MTKKDQQRIAREFCSSFRERMMGLVGLFPANWDGMHVRALAQLLVEHNLPDIGAARRDIRRSDLNTNY